MNKRLTVFVGLLILVACGEASSVEKDPISETQKALKGVWLESTETDTIEWVFTYHKVKWRGFSHYYKVKNDQLIISGLTHTIQEQNENQWVLMNPNGVVSVLRRKVNKSKD